MPNVNPLKPNAGQQRQKILQNFQPILAQMPSRRYNKNAWLWSLYRAIIRCLCEDKKASKLSPQLREAAAKCTASLVDKVIEESLKQFAKIRKADKREKVKLVRDVRFLEEKYEECSLELNKLSQKLKRRNKRKGTKQASPLPEGNYNDKDDDNDDVCIIENEEVENKPVPAPRAVSKASVSSEEELDEKRSISSTAPSSTTSSSTSSSEEEEEETDFDEKPHHDEPENELHHDEPEDEPQLQPEEPQPPQPPVPITEAKAQQREEDPVETSPSLSRSSSIMTSSSSSLSSSSSSSEDESRDSVEQEPEKKPEVVEEIVTECAENVITQQEDVIPAEPTATPSSPAEKTPVSTEIIPVASPKDSRSIDLGSITLSLRIETGTDNSNPTVHVERHSFENRRSKSSSSSSSSTMPEPEMKLKLSSENNDIEVIRRYDSPQSPLVYDPVQRKMISDLPDVMYKTSSSEEDIYPSAEFAGEEETVAGIINVTSGEKLTICQAVKNGLIPKKTALLLLEAQAATGGIVNPRNGVKLSVSDAVTLGIVDEVYKDTLIAAEGAYYGFMDPRSGESVSLNEAMSRNIFPRLQGIRLLEAQAATGGIVDPWTGLRYPLNSAMHKELIDSETANLLKNSEEQTEFYDPSTQKRMGYSDILSKCIRDLDTGLKFLYIEEKPKTSEVRYQPDLLTFRSAFRRKVTLQELIDAGLVENPVLEAFQAGRINKEELRDILQPYLVGEEPIAGIFNRTTHKVLSVSQAVKDGLLRRGTATELLEAQAATGNIIDPISGKKMSVSRAISIGLVDNAYASALRGAEQAVHGFTEPGTKRTISLFEAMSRGVVIESHGIRMLDAQLATGGLIDPQAGYRIPGRIAQERGLLSERLAEIIQSNNVDMKGYYDPNTGDNVTYGELMQRCVKSKKYGNFLLLPIKDRTPMAPAFQKSPYKQRKVMIQDPHNKKQLTVDQALAAGVIDRETAKQLTRQEESWTGNQRHT
ncbi:uncharacterized protein LOC143462073 isoform X1 [Clavelina lepadiformis]|uniref:uncharacterized protein LOC143462073 isoform X1 n=1 Tax=Clavelina lepadiformis TaxID=159417 RepID=UPI00404226F2